MEIVHEPGQSNEQEPIVEATTPESAAVTALSKAIDARSAAEKPITKRNDSPYFVR